MKANVKKHYADRRVKEYPSIEDQLDALWKGGVAVTEMRDRINNIKRRFPKENT